jgi:hypothetical protein
MTEHRSILTAAEILDVYRQKHGDLDDATLGCARSLQPPPEVEPSQLRSLCDTLSRGMGCEPWSDWSIVASVREYSAFSMLIVLGSSQYPAVRHIASALLWRCAESCDLPHEETGADIQYRHCLALRQLSPAWQALKVESHRATHPDAQFGLLERAAELLRQKPPEPSAEAEEIGNVDQKIESVIEILSGTRTIGARRRRADSRDYSYADAPRVDAVAQRIAWVKARASRATLLTLASPLQIDVDVDEQEKGNTTHIVVRPSIATTRDDLLRSAIEKDARAISNTFSPSDSSALPEPFIGEAFALAAEPRDPRALAWTVALAQTLMPRWRMGQTTQEPSQVPLIPDGAARDHAPFLSRHSAMLSYRILGMSDASDQWMHVALSPALAQILCDSLRTAPASVWIKKAARNFVRHQSFVDLTGLLRAVRRWHVLNPYGLDLPLIDLVRGELTSVDRVLITYRQIELALIQRWIHEAMSHLFEVAIGPRLRSSASLELLSDWFKLPVAGPAGAVGTTLRMADDLVAECQSALRRALHRKGVPALAMSRDAAAIVTRLNAAIDELRFEILLSGGVRPLDGESPLTLIAAGKRWCLHACDKETHTEIAARIVPLRDALAIRIRQHLLDFLEAVERLAALGARLDATVARHIDGIKAMFQGAWALPLRLGNLTLGADFMLSQKESNGSDWQDAVAATCPTVREHKPNATRRRHATRLVGLEPIRDTAARMGHLVSPGAFSQLSSMAIGDLPLCTPDGEEQRLRKLWRVYT